MNTKHFYGVLLLCLLSHAALADVWQDPETKVNYDYEIGSGEAKVKEGTSWNNTYTPGSPDAVGDINILSSFSVGGRDYTVTEIGSLAFAGNDNITGIRIPKTVKSIAGNAFFYCSGIEGMEVSNGNPHYSSRGNAIIREEKITDGNTIAIYQTVTLVAGCKTTTIPTDIDAIGYGAFRGCSGLTSISIPKNIQKIGQLAFMDCTGLTNVRIGEGVSEIPYSCFGGCSSLTNVVIDESVESIGSSAFINCTSLPSITIPSNMNSIGSHAFWNCKGLKEVHSLIKAPFTLIYDAFSNYDIPLYVPTGTKEKYEATASWNKFQQIIEDNEAPLIEVDGNTFTAKTVEGIEMTFKILSTEEKTCQVGIGVNDELIMVPAVAYETSGHVTIPALARGYTVKEIGKGAFMYLEGITSVNIPDNVTYIDWYAFSDCYRLESVNIPKCIEWIGDCAFRYCNLSSVEFPDTDTQYDIGKCAFMGNNLRSIRIPKYLSGIGLCAFSLNNLETIEVDPQNRYYGPYNRGSNAIINQRQELIAGCANTVIPDYVKAIYEGAFAGCTGLKEITIPSSVTEIKGSRNIIIGDLFGVRPMYRYEIVPGAFENCSGLLKVTSLIEEPFKIDETVFWDYYNDAMTSATLYVPKGTKEEYQATTGWNGFKTIIEIGDQPKGDVNGDLTVDVADIASVIDVMAKGDNDAVADVNKDGTVDVADIATIIDVMAGR